MPKKNKSQAAGGLGRSIVRDRFGKKSRGNRELSSRHTADLQDGYDWGRLNLQSVTEQSNLDDFLTTAELAGTEFNAEKLNVKFIDPDGDAGLLSEEARRTVSKVQEEHKSCLKIPRRPLWDEFTSPEELDRLEKDSFLEWRRELALLQEKEHLVMTPFEKNLEFWRQLWRVIERSDIIVQIVDARNPLLFRCEDLEAYVKEVNPNKVNAILVNKADLLTQKQREMWADYFSSIDVKVIFWSAMLETEKLKMKDAGDDIEDGDVEDEDHISDEDDDDDDAADVVHDGDDDIAAAADDEVEVGENVDNKEVETYCAMGGEGGEKMDAETGEGSKSEHIGGKREKVDSGLGPWNENDPISGQNNVSGAVDMSCDCADISETKPCEMDVSEGQETRTCDSVEVDSKQVSNHGEILSGMDLLETLKSFHHGETYTPGQTTIGLVGYPNVGKSSTINAILRTKKVPVSATPGRTKHFQTLYVEPTLMLCDCPGLVMPSFVSTKAEMIICGILPIDQMRDFVPPVALVCQLIPRNNLEQIYGINIRKPREGEDPDRPPTAHELLTSYGYMRGFMTHKGIPDLSRSSRIILKDFVSGKLPYCHPPPGVDADEFKPAPPPPEKPLPFKHKGKAVKAATEVTSTRPQEFHSEIDKAFFAKDQHKVRSKGVHGVEGFQRKEGLSTHVSEGSETGSLYGSSTTMSEKPWKRHNNKKKKEKLRRTYAALDHHEIM